jgi:outer membrane protein TolC
MSRIGWESSHTRNGSCLMTPPLRITCALLFLSLACGAWAEPLLGLEQAWREALSGHRDAERARLDLEELRLERQAALLRLAPRLQLSLSGPGILETRNEVWTGSGDSLRLTRVAWRQRREAGGLSLNTELPLGTSLSLSADGWRRSSSTGSFADEVGRSLGAVLRQDLLPRATLWGDLEESARETEVAGREIRDQLAGFRHRVALAFLDALRGQQGLELSRRDREVSRANLERAKGRFEAGWIAESDFLKVELEDLQQQAAFQSDSMDQAVRELALCHLLGRTPPLPPLDPLLPELAVPPHRDSLEHAVDELSAALARRRLEEAKARRARRSSSLDRLPELSLELGWGRGSEGPDWDSLDEPVLDRSATLRLDWPLFAGGEKSRARERAGMTLRRAELALEETREHLRQEADRLWREWEEVRVQAPLLERQVELAQKDADISQERFQAGQITSQLLIDAERALSQARLRRLDLALREARVRLDLARLAGTDREALP